jgi:acyl-CoA synthetase (NDP forming)
MSNAGHAKKTTENPRQFAFGGWPAHTLLEAGEIPIIQIAELALREGQSTISEYESKEVLPAYGIPVRRSYW